jgi:hypothetical protein
VIDDTTKAAVCVCGHPALTHLHGDEDETCTVAGCACVEFLTLTAAVAEIAGKLESAAERALETALADLADRSPEFREGYTRGFRDAAILVLGGSKG